MPLPIVRATPVDDEDVEIFGLKTVRANSTSYEMTPLEFGTWDGPVSSFTPMEWVGTALYNGSAVNESACIRGFDRASFILGTVEDAFNYWYIEDYSNDTLAQFSKRSSDPTTSVSKRTLFPNSTINALITIYNQTFDLDLTDIVYSRWPNPLYGLPTPPKTPAPPRYLNFVDATESGQAIPLLPLLQPERTPSLILAWDNNEDSIPYNWNNGTNLYDTYLFSTTHNPPIPFPIIPSPSTMLTLNQTIQPTFFGCNTSLTTTPHTNELPIILYLPNAPYSAYTNFSYTKPTASIEQMTEILTNSWDLITAGNGTIDEEWAACLGCAVIERSLEGVGMRRSWQCERCFERYCWDGTVDDSMPAIFGSGVEIDGGGV